MRLKHARANPSLSSTSVRDSARIIVRASFLVGGAISAVLAYGPRPPWSPPFAPPTPQQIALPCSPASQLLWPRPTSHARASSATASRLPNADRRTRKRTLNRRPDVGYPRFRRNPFARDVLFRPRRDDSASHNGVAHVAFDHNDSLRSREFIISWLNHTPHATAVYASCSASPPPHATLASRRLARPYLGRTCTG